MKVHQRPSNTTSAVRCRRFIRNLPGAGRTPPPPPACIPQPSRVALSSARPLCGSRPVARARTTGPAARPSVCANRLHCIDSRAQVAACGVSVARMYVARQGSAGARVQRTGGCAAAGPWPRARYMRHSGRRRGGGQLQTHFPVRSHGPSPLRTSEQHWPIPARRTAQSLGRRAGPFSQGACVRVCVCVHPRATLEAPLGKWSSTA